MVRVQAACGLEADARFRAHLTLARARDRSGTDATALLEAAYAPAGSIRVDRVVLYRSHLSRGPARYETVVSQPLRGVP